MEGCACANSGQESKRGAFCVLEVKDVKDQIVVESRRRRHLELQRVRGAVSFCAVIASEFLEFIDQFGRCSSSFEQV